PKAGSVIGWSTGTATPRERFLDIRAASRSRWTALMFKRLDLAKSIGCDAIEADRNDIIMSDPGFTIDPLESYSWYGDVATQLHMRKLSAGMKDGNALPSQTDMMADKYDWLMIERCGEYQDCDSARPFVNLKKAVFAIDYDHNIDGM